MVATSQIESRLAFEPQTTPVDPSSRGSDSVARESNKPDLVGGSAPRATTGGREPADSVEISNEPQTTPVDPSSRGSDSVARESNKPDLVGGSAPRATTGGREPADSVEISNEAQRIAANDPGTASRTRAPQDNWDTASQGLNSTVETSATADTGSSVGETPDRAASTNQVTSFESERTGNDTRNETEAGRTLGQVIDTFA